jgi:uncharacterized LabA/DUF88 family protein
MGNVIALALTNASVLRNDPLRPFLMKVRRNGRHAGVGHLMKGLSMQRYAILIDGAFAIRKLQKGRAAFPAAADIEAIGAALAATECLRELSRLRVYFYHARPAIQTLTNPISKRQVALGETRVHANHVRLLSDLEIAPDFALRLGETHTVGWKIGDTAFRRLLRQPKAIQAEDLTPAIEQKGVDLRMGLDIARLALTHSVDAIVVVTGDSDLVPAFKFARREGLRVFLCHLGHGVKRELRVHADRIIRLDLSAIRPAQTRLEEAA